MATENGTMTAEQIGKRLAELKDKDRKLYQEFRKKYYKYVDIPDEDLDDPVEVDDAGRPQPQKGANRDPATWTVVQMRDDPALWKVVDDKGINVADLFKTKEGAQKYIDDFKKAPSPEPVPEPTPVPPPTTTEPTPPAGPTEPVVSAAYPYAAKGAAMPSTQRGPTTRHYASGKPDDETIEKNVKEITFDNYQFVIYLTMHKMEHDDTVSTKIGGTHMGSGWFDHGVGIYTGQTCLGKEEDHPSTDLCVIKGPKVGDIREKKIGVAATYFKKINKTEFWLDLGQGWKKQCEGTNVGGFNPKSAINEAQLRIDGFVKDSIPSIHSAVVTEIAAQG